MKDNEILIFSELMDAKSLFLTANADTVYFLGFIDLSKGPMVLEAPPKALGALDDFWFRWVTDFGQLGPDRGEGGKYLILPPGYNGPLPDGRFYIAPARTTRVLLMGRSFMENNDPKPTAELIKKATKIYPFEPRGLGTSVAEFLSGKYKLAKINRFPRRQWQGFRALLHSSGWTIVPSEEVGQKTSPRRLGGAEIPCEVSANFHGTFRTWPPRSAKLQRVDIPRRLSGEPNRPAWAGVARYGQGG